MTLAALQFFLDARVKIPAIEQTTDGIDGGGLGERSRLHKRALPSERERERRRQSPQGRQIASRKRAAVGAIGDAQDAEDFFGRQDRHGGK